MPQSKITYEDFKRMDEETKQYHLFVKLDSMCEKIDVFTEDMKKEHASINERIDSKADIWVENYARKIIWGIILLVVGGVLVGTFPQFKDIIEIGL